MSALSQPQPRLPLASSAKMQPNHSSVNYRHSRRFACDHCRAYKLRCERDSRVGTSCNRCLTTQLACTTTVNYSPQRRPSAAAQEQSTTDGRGGSNNNTTKQPRKEPRLAATRTLPSQFSSTAINQQDKPSSPPQPPTPASLPGSQPQAAAGKELTGSSVPKVSSQRQPEPIQGPTRIVDTMEGHPMDGGDGIILGQDCLVLDGMDFNMPDICYDAADMALLMADPSEHGGTGSRRIDGGVNLGMFGEDGETTMNVNLTAWQSSTSAHHFMNAANDPETDSERHVRPPTKSYKELLKLSLELIEDQELLDTQAPLTSKHKPGLVCSNSTQHHPINRMLNHTTRFWEMLKGISATSDATQHHCSSYETTATGSSSNSSQSNIGQDWTWAGASDTNYGSRDSSLPSSFVSLPRQDHLLIVNLVTTYVYLVRSCQGVFTRLYNALEMTPAADFSSILNLPSLQFGEFQLQNNLAIQVKVLIELISSMLLRIEETLGISQVNSSKRSPVSDKQNYRLSILNDPMAVSIREIILSQERMQGGIYSGELAFSDVISNLKQLLERK